MEITMEDVRNLERGEGQGVNGPRQGDGGAENCKCPKCGKTAVHTKGVPCNQIMCPTCKVPMIGS